MLFMVVVYMIKGYMIVHIVVHYADIIYYFIRNGKLFSKTF